MRLDTIKSTISAIPFVTALFNVLQDEVVISGEFEISLKDLDKPLSFKFIISNEYPLKSFESESITFFNVDLIAYKHVMKLGNICIHTSHSLNLKEKVEIDFNALKEWIIKYYIKNSEDVNYEHLVVNDSEINGSKYSFTFSETDKDFSLGEVGVVNLSALNDGVHKNNHIANFYVKSFKSLSGLQKTCSWSTFYSEKEVCLEGLYYFRKETPAMYGKFIYSIWNQINLPAVITELLYKFEQDNLEKNRGKVIPLFIGYKINNEENHWQVALLEVGQFPIIGEAEKKEGRKTGRWITKITNTEIKWGLTKNASYKYFFGRGKFSDKITNKKILIIGIGAVGSMIAKTLTQCGCTHIDFIDHDIKEPENICRSEYQFRNGITNKTAELEKILYEISPFINTNKLNNGYFEKFIKSFYLDEIRHEKIEKQLNEYELIFDCSTDNDLMYVLNKLKLDTELINISLTNHASELICAFYPNIYRFVNNQFSNILNNDVTDLYEPTGCWNPTFKASYNDIALLVQIALKKINKIYDEKKGKNNFVIQEIDNNLKILEY